LSRQLDKLNNQLKTIAAWRPFFYNPNPRPMPRKPPESPELSLANFMVTSYKVEDSSVSGNYYPVTSDISINDKNRKITAIIMNDRAQGGSVSGLKDGTVELMIHRRLVTDDGIGIHEVLNEKEYNKGLYARGQHYFTFGYKDLHIRNGEYLYFTIY
jgi:hypothetical protein